MKTSEAHLWSQFQQGDEGAFRQLHQQHVRHLLNYGLRVHDSLTVVEDCIQDLFLELWQYRRTLAQPDSVRFYLLKSLRNRLSVVYRKTRPFIAGWDSDELEQPFLVEPSAEQRLVELDMDGQLRERMQHALSQLSPRQREILYLRYFNELSYEQICELMNINYQTARSQIYNALKLLRTNWKSEWLLLFTLYNNWQ